MNRKKEKNSELFVKYKIWFVLIIQRGISHGTLELIKNYMKELNDYTSISAISRNTGLAYQTVHRYLQHLIDHDKVDVHQVYGKIGRPKQSYRWIK